MNRKICFFLISICVLSSVNLRAQWVTEQCPSENNLKAIAFTGNNTGWIVGDNGTILCRSENQWKNYQNPTKNNLNSIFMIDEKEGWAVGDKGTIVQFTGKVWDNVESPVENNLYSVSFSDPENGIAVGANGVILKYENRRWIKLNQKVLGNLYTTALNEDVTWIGGGLECVSVPIMKIQNDQSGKVTNSVKLSATITGLAMINPKEGWAVGSPSTMMHFNGSRWNKADLDFRYPSLRSVFFSDKDNGISSGYGGTVLIYKRGTWTIEKTSTTLNLNGAFITGNSYYAVGDKGLIITKKIDPSKDLKANDKTKLFNISIYPNPSDGMINFIMPVENDSPDFITSVSNSEGQVIFQKEFQSGNGNLPYQIITDSFSNGIYVLKVIQGNKKYISKFIIEH
jgi:photosystem II stability/assembly factor-like uncharacterized protein